MTEPLRAIDLCCGAGGWACAARGLPISVVAAIDHWETCCETYRLNHPSVKILCADVCDRGTRKAVLGFDRIDIILGGIPCEWVSIYRNGWNPKTRPTKDEIRREQATLGAVLALVRKIDPCWWCLEDVKGVTRYLPPLTPWVQIDAAAYSAQRRRRVYIGKFPAPLPGASADLLARHLRPGPFRVGRRTLSRRPATSNIFDGKSFMPADPKKKSPTICNFGGRRDAEIAVLDGRLPGGKRQFEWQEAARLQGFPEDYLFVGSLTDVWLQVARAIQIDVGRAILEAICREAFGVGIAPGFPLAGSAEVAPLTPPSGGKEAPGP